MKPRLLVFTSTFPRWVNDTDPPFVYELCRRLTEDFDIHVVTPIYPGAAREQVIEGIQVTRFRYFLPAYEKLAGATGILPTIRNNKLYYLVVPFFLLASFFALWSATRKLRPTLIHAHWIIPQGAIAYIVGEVCNTNYVVTAHGADVFGLKGRFFDSVRSIVMRNAAAVTVVSRALEDMLRSGMKGVSEIDVVPMGVDSLSFSGNAEENLSETDKAKRSRNLLYVGRLTEKKGVRYLLLAVAEARKNYPDIHLTVVGSGELQYELEELSRFLGLADTVHFVGGLPNAMLPEIYRKHGIFVAPSIEARGGDTEGFGLTLVEAGMAGCLVISTGVGGTTDILQDGVTGLKVEQKNERDLAAKIVYALNNPTTMQEITKRMKARCISNFDWQVISEKYLATFKKIST